MGKRSYDAGRFKFLHGDLDIWILEARSLPNMDLMSERMRKCFTMYGACSAPRRHSESNHRGMSKMITSDPYVSVCVAGATIAQTRVIPNSEDPKWEEHFCVPVAHPTDKIEFQVKDNDVFGAQMIGVATIPVERILSGEPLTGWFPVIDHSGVATKPYPDLHLSLQFKSIDGNPLYRDGIGAGPEYTGVPNAYFPLHRRGQITLYQDAHVPDNMLPEIELDNGKFFEHSKCWEDTCHAIVEAHHFIYIVGWSVYHRVKLVREPTRPVPANGGELTLGELLKYKTQEGVRVVMLIWDDKTSHDKFLLKTVVGTLFTHHQKCVIMDTHANGNNRKVTAFIGGLDLCDGRYDTPEHRLFADLDSVFHKDIHNPTFQVSDISRFMVVVLDVHMNLHTQNPRWRKATKWRDFKLRKVTHWNDDALIKIERISWILSPSAYQSGSQTSTENDPENWHVQIFRSIDSGSVKGFPKVVQQAEAMNLVCAKNLKIDKSIHTAYVKAIRAAQHFIYIENQYFIGSSYFWPSYKNAGADNLIPMELTLKIVSKIKAKERFAVYVVVPMWPEGIPTSGAVQEILFWQGQTISMMYKVIGDALKEAGLSETKHPQDYLNFYCLGKCEPLLQQTQSSNTSQENAPQRLSQKFRRFMIYVHSKGMIVDDEAVIIGSANINQRSMEGSRDTEIAMGAYQPHYSWAARHGHPRGQVYGYRMSLWAEHMGVVSDCFQEPQSLECVRHVNSLAQENWNSYAAPEIKRMKGHLLQYPLVVEPDGRVGPLPGCESFPDVGGKILGAHSTLPDVLTT
ncbi:hypothetical protein ZIOFF_042996 [Zingiber officinale]|uniref:Phospholipase D n=1 Tax=Zingiber officinale TaxID=94328 RepID=A0A8J5KPD0_ZINOF|nr:hypothetical protein ZIOFF_042996 [Zingiber officinale]